jgi:iduronate 2-sulfatase
VGKLLDTLKETGLSKSTIVIFVADHGYHLGENGLIGKHTDFEHSTHVPLMVSIPGQTDNGCVSDSIVELVDIFPTVVDASGLGPLPKCSVDSSNTTLCTEGTSLLPLITNPKTELRSGAVSQIVRFLSMGYTLRTKRFRYTEWTNFTNPTTSAEMVWNNITKSELFDHDIDPEENTNYSQHEIYQKHRHELRSMLHKLVNLELRMKELHYFFSFMRPPV